MNGRKAVIGQRVHPLTDVIELDGSRVMTDPDKIYLMLNKPSGVITTSKDPQRRKTVMQIVGENERVFPVGRLDVNTEGLLLLTNDGDLAFRLTHPSFEVEKIYVAEVQGAVRQSTLRKLRSGVDVGEDRPARADSARILDTAVHPPRTVVELIIHEGRKHVVRRMLEALGHPVSRLTRTKLGPLSLGRLAVGTYRRLTTEELRMITKAVGL